MRLFAALMPRLLACATLCAALIPPPAFAKDVAGSSDHPLVGRYDGAQISYFNRSDFDRVDLLNAAMPARAVSAIPADKRLRVEGRRFSIVYSGPADRSALEIDANFAASLKSRGFETLFSCANSDCASGSQSFYWIGGLLDSQLRNGAYEKSIAYRLEKLSRPQGDVYVAILSGKGGGAPVTRIEVVEVKPMQDDKIVFLTARQMKDGLDVAGRVALYGVFFDTDKDVPRPESAPTLAEIARLLQSDPGLKLIVAGHTDNQGAFDYNVALSQRRAAAVVAALVKSHAIKADRLTPFGAGMAAPTASNAGEAGRAKNRRVELVKR